MKKLLFKSLLILSVILIASCSSSDNEDLTAASSIRMTLNGESLTFDTLTVNTTTDGGVFGDPTVEITGIIGSSTTKVVTISIEEGATGSNSLNSFEYVDSSAGININYTPVFIGSTGITCGNTTAPIDVSNFVTATNNGNAASGNFSSTIYKCENNAVVTYTITNGSFTVNY